MELPERVAHAIAERVVALVVDAVDINAILARVDVDQLLARIDLDAILARVDLNQLLTRLDLTSIMGGTATTAAEEALGVLRRSSEQGDQVTARWVRQLVSRR